VVLAGGNAVCCCVNARVSHTPAAFLIIDAVATAECTTICTRLGPSLPTVFLNDPPTREPPYITLAPSYLHTACVIGYRVQTGGALAR